MLTSVPAQDLRKLGALVFAVTREPAEWERALSRRDQLTVWGVGAHPGVATALSTFDPVAFSDAAEKALLIGEVGLDGRAKTSSLRQREVFEAVLEVVAVTPRPVSIHSVGACRAVLDALKERPIVAPILHWWRGDQAQTEEAIELGCYFSLNGAEIASPKVLDLLPAQRVLTETDFPHTRKRDPAASKPAEVGTIEAGLMDAWGLGLLGVREQLWRNLAGVVDSCDLFDALPARVQELLLTAGLDDS